MTTDPAHDGFARLHERASRGDGEAAAALMILTENWARPKAEAFVGRDGIDFAAMLSAHDSDDVDDGTCLEPGTDGGCCDCGPYWSTGEALMLRLAWNLWAGTRASAVNLARLLDTCGDRLLGLAMEAITARNGGQLPVYGPTSPSRGAAPTSRTSAWSSSRNGASEPHSRVERM